MEKNQQTLNNLGLSEKNKMGITGYILLNKKHSLEEKKNKLLRLYNAFFKNKKTNSIDLRKMKKKHDILVLVNILTIPIIIIIGVKLGVDLISYTETVNNLEHNILANIALFKTDLILFLSCTIGYIFELCIFEKLKKDFKIYRDNNALNTNSYEKEQVLEFIDNYELEIRNINDELKSLSNQMPEKEVVVAEHDSVKENNRILMEILQQNDSNDLSENAKVLSKSIK